MNERAYSDKRLAELLPWPEASDNKYSRGKLVLVAGSAAYPGAACLAAAGGSRMGAGYVQVYCADEAVATVRAYRPSFVVAPWSRGISLESPSTSRKPVSYVVGPGFDAQDRQCGQIAAAVLQSAADAAVPLLVDGGALTALASSQMVSLFAACAEAGAPAVLTPHGGEAARLASALCVPTFSGQPGDARGQSDFAQRLSRALDAVIVLKGPDTVVAYRDDVAFVTEGTAALAKAGTGDILAGMVGGLLAQGCAAFDAAVLGVTLHARAGRIAGERMTDIAVMPEDVLDAIPGAIRTIGSSVNGSL